MGDNGEQEKQKACPFNGKWCGDWCPLLIEFGQLINGIPHKVKMCVFVGTNQILSEMNMKLQQQGKPVMPRIQLPGNLGRG